MTITYVGHSCFCVELAKVVFIFDYFEGKLPTFDPKKELFYFVSHKHKDHYNPVIFEAVREYPNIHFILSNDMKMNERYMDRREIPVKAREHIRYAKINDEFQATSSLFIKTIKSTDEGVAYLLEYKENAIRLYHAGDMNWWTWHGETKEEYEEMTHAFLTEMRKIEGQTFDVAFVPLDPRQEERFYWGFDYFMRSTDTKKVFPMHCWEDYSVIPRLIDMEESEPYRERIQLITKRNQVFLVE